MNTRRLVFWYGSVWNLPLSVVSPDTDFTARALAVFQSGTGNVCHPANKSVICLHQHHASCAIHQVHAHNLEHPQKSMLLWRWQRGENRSAKVRLGIQFTTSSHDCTPPGDHIFSNNFSRSHKSALASSIRHEPPKPLMTSILTLMSLTISISIVCEHSHFLNARRWHLPSFPSSTCLPQQPTRKHPHPHSGQVPKFSQRISRYWRSCSLRFPVPHVHCSGRHQLLDVPQSLVQISHRLIKRRRQRTMGIPFVRLSYSQSIKRLCPHLTASQHQNLVECAESDRKPNSSQLVRKCA